MQSKQVEEKEYVVHKKFPNVQNANEAKDVLASFPDTTFKALVVFRTGVTVVGKGNKKRWPLWFFFFHIRSSLSELIKNSPEWGEGIISQASYPAADMR